MQPHNNVRTSGRLLCKHLRVLVHAESTNAGMSRNKVEMSPFVLVSSTLTYFAEKYVGASGERAVFYLRALMCVSTAVYLQGRW
jgi:hypothetical protein